MATASDGKIVIWVTYKLNPTKQICTQVCNYGSNLNAKNDEVLKILHQNVAANYSIPSHLCQINSFIVLVPARRGKA